MAARRQFSSSCCSSLLTLPSAIEPLDPCSPHCNPAPSLACYYVQASHITAKPEEPKSDHFASSPLREPARRWDVQAYMRCRIPFFPLSPVRAYIHTYTHTYYARPSRRHLSHPSQFSQCILRRQSDCDCPYCSLKGGSAKSPTYNPSQHERTPRELPYLYMLAKALLRSGK